MATSSSLFRTQSSRSAAEITADVETGSLIACRICLEKEGDELISPCLCKGTQEFVHRQCLDHWRSVKEGFAFSHCTTCKAEFHFRVKKDLNDNFLKRMKRRLFVLGDVLYECLVANLIIAIIGGYVYLLDSEGTLRNSLSNRIWLFSNDPFNFFYSIGAIGFLIILGASYLLRLCVALGNRDRRIAASQNLVLVMGMMNCFPAPILIMVVVVVFVLFGAAYGAFVLAIVVQKSWQRHSIRLEKQNLTQVYVVVDMHGQYTPPQLDPIHKQHLKDLNLW